MGRASRGETDSTCGFLLAGPGPERSEPGSPQSPGGFDEEPSVAGRLGGCIASPSRVEDVAGRHRSVPPPPQEEVPGDRRKKTAILRAPAFAVILRLKLAGDSLSRVSSSPCEAARHALRVGRRRLATDRLKSGSSGPQSPHGSEPRESSNRSALARQSLGEDSLDEGFREGRIFVGLRKFEAKQDAVFSRPRARPFVEEASPRAQPISAIASGKPQRLRLQAARRLSASQPPGD